MPIDRIAMPQVILRIMALCTERLGAVGRVALPTNLSTPLQKASRVDTSWADRSSAPRGRHHLVLRIGFVVHRECLPESNGTSPRVACRGNSGHERCQSVRRQCTGTPQTGSPPAGLAW